MSKIAAKEKLIPYNISQPILHILSLSSAILLAICSLHTLEALYDGGRIMTRDNTEWGPFTRKFKTLRLCSAHGRGRCRRDFQKPTNERERGILFGMNWIRNERSAQTPSEAIYAPL